MHTFKFLCYPIQSTYKPFPIYIYLCIPFQTTCLNRLLSHCSTVLTFLFFPCRTSIAFFVCPTSLVDFLFFSFSFFLSCGPTYLSLYTKNQVIFSFNISRMYMVHLIYIHPFHSDSLREKVFLWIFPSFSTLELIIANRELS